MFFIIRPVKSTDLDDMLELASLAGFGMTSLPNDKDKMLARIQKSTSSFDKNSTRSQLYIFVLEDLQTKKVIGTTNITRTVDIVHPLYSFQQIHTDGLLLAQSHQGATEIGGLFLHPDHRNGFLGKFLSQVRFLFIAQFNERFNNLIISRLRGVHDHKNSPFYHAVWGKDIAMTFSGATEHLSTNGPDLFIRTSTLMQGNPVDLKLRTMQLFGKTHPDSAPAKKLLLKQGFEFYGNVDMLDAGPILEAVQNNILPIKQSTLAENIPTFTKGHMIVTNTNIDDFRAVLIGGEYEWQHLGLLKLEGFARYGMLL